MTNLLSNAIKFTPDGGRIAVDLGTENGHLCFVVRDTGVCIALEDQNRIFEKFYRVNRTGQQVPGTGLGLTKVRAVVEHYGGRVQVESKVDQGSCFTVFLPLTTVRQATLQEPTRKEPLH